MRSSSTANNAGASSSDGGNGGGNPSTSGVVPPAPMARAGSRTGGLSRTKSKPGSPRGSVSGKAAFLQGTDASSSGVRQSAFRVVMLSFFFFSFFLAFLFVVVCGRAVEAKCRKTKCDNAASMRTRLCGCVYLLCQFSVQNFF